MVFIRSKWFVNFIQRGEQQFLKRENKEMPPTIRAIKWWTNKVEYQEDWNGNGTSMHTFS